MSASQELLNEREASARLGVNRVTLFRLRKQGRIAYVKIGPLVRYEPEAIERFVAQHTHPTRPLLANPKP